MIMDCSVVKVQYKEVMGYTNGVWEKLAEFENDKDAEYSLTKIMAAIENGDKICDISIDDKDIGELNLTVRTYNCLHNVGIKTIRELKYMTDEQLMSIKNIGRKSYKELKEKLDAYYKR